MPSKVSLLGASEAPAVRAGPRQPERSARIAFADTLRYLAASRFVHALALSQLLAVAWWGVAAWLRPLGIIPVWYDQAATFTLVGAHWRDPYAISGFINPPWAALLLVPFGWLPLPLAVLAQLCLYFALLAGLIFKYGGGHKAVVIALTSFLAFDNALELNIDWVIALGLLLPPVYSGPLLLLKPQLALGAWFALRGRTLTRAVLVALTTLVLSLAAWPRWPLQLADALAFNLPRQVVSIAPLTLMPPLLAIAIGLALAWHAYRKHDPAWGLLAWLFFAPYLPFYSLLLHFAVLAARNRRLALLLSALLWLVYGGVLSLVWLAR